MTTGSVTTSDADKRAYAARSHAWNLEQRRFKEAFPDVSRCFFSHFEAVQSRATSVAYRRFEDVAFTPPQFPNLARRPHSAISPFPITRSIPMLMTRIIPFQTVLLADCQACS